VDFSSLLLILCWLIPLWLLGWLVLPLARQIFVNLPDSGLAAGRTLSIVLLSLLAFWGASFHVLPLTLAPLLFFGLPLLCAAWTLRTPLARVTFRQWMQEHRRALIASDLIFIAAFAFFLWIRLRHPETNDLEKGMDVALMSALERTRFLPAENPWFSGTPFTNYYYFGHLMGALLARTLGTPITYAYNLIFPAFCAFFIAPLWSLCTALTGSLQRGTIAMSMVALCGHFEPLRQWAKHDPGTAQDLFRLDWWSTSRVIPDTINEYPIFTTSIGDAHAHFFALALASTFFCGCYALFAPHAFPVSTASSASRFPAWLDRRRIVLLLLGILLGTFWLTNTWDLPLYGGLALLCALWTLPVWYSGHSVEAKLEEEAISSNSNNKKKSPKTNHSKTKNQKPKADSQSKASETPIADSSTSTRPPDIVAELLWVFAPLPLARLVAAPYLQLFQPQISGVVREFYSPPGYEFLLLWAGFLGLWILALGARQHRNYWVSAFAILGIAVLLGREYLSLSLVIAALTLTLLSTFVNGLPFEKTPTDSVKAEQVEPISYTFAKLMAFCGLLALLGPMLFYIKGVFGDGPNRHQDTFFKFGVQAWLLLGTAAVCLAISSFCTLLRSHRAVQWIGGIAWAALWSIPVMCAACVVWTRTVRDAPREPPGDPNGQFILSLNAARFLPPAEQSAIEWLRDHAKAGDTLLEAVAQPQGPGADYNASYGRVAAFTGVPTAVAWPQHLNGWGIPYDDMNGHDSINKRSETIRRIYAWPDNQSGLAALQQLGVRYVFVGSTERSIYNPAALSRLKSALPNAYENGDTFIAEAPGGAK